ncbi:MAG: alpha-amylase family glycosyl hydrolase, partial [Mycobacteriales bacterium]
IRSVVDSYDGQRTTVGEVYILSTRRVAEYYGDGDELHMSFNFPPLHAPWDAAAWRVRIERVVESFDPREAWPTWVLSNHDVRRHRTRYGSEARARAAAVLLLGLRGTPFLYAGEELGLEDAAIPPGRALDPGGRDGCRAPLPWDEAPDHGWATEDPWLPWPPEPEDRNVAVARGDEHSILHLYRRLLAARRDSPALSAGAFAWIDSPEGVLAWRRQADGDERVVVVSFVDDDTRVTIEGSWTIEVSTERAREGTTFDGRLAPDEALVLHR